MAEKTYPLLLLDNASMYVIGAGTYRCTNLTFEEAKAILESHSASDIWRCYTDTDIDRVIHDYLGIERQDFPYHHIRRMRPGQDAIIFKQYITPSETQPVVTTKYGEQAKKIQNIYVYCQYIIRES